MKILICGDRDWNDSLFMLKVMEWLIEEFGVYFVISGGAPGADILAILWAKRFGLPYHEERAQWEKYGKAAGHIRNKAMLDMNPDLVVAFHNDIDKSKGTKNCLDQAKKKGIETRLYSIL